MLWMAVAAGLSAQPHVGIRGYLKELAGLSISNDLSTARYDNIVHHRIESSWEFGHGFGMQADARTRLISGWSVRHTPGYAGFLSDDPGVVDLSFNWLDGRDHVLNTTIDRLHLGWSRGAWEVQAGRQRINWGKTMVWNPNDLFNAYAWLDFDYEERPGTDAVDVRYSWSYASSVEFGYRLGRTMGETVLAGMWRGNAGTYDLQAVAGYYREQAIVGGGWSGYVGSSGFKGEISWFLPDNTLSAVVGGDHMLPSGVFLTGELLYNGGWNRGAQSVAAVFQPPTASNLFVASTGYFASAAFTPHPLVSANMGMLGSFTRSVHILIPQISYSVGENIDALLLAQVLRGGAFKAATDTPNAVFLRLKWSY